MEVFELKGHHVMSGKDIRIVFALRRRKHQRPIDAILNVFDLGGVHVTSVVKVPTRHVPRVVVLDTNIQVVGRR